MMTMCRCKPARVKSDDALLVPVGGLLRVYDAWCLLLMGETSMNFFSLCASFASTATIIVTAFLVLWTVSSSGTEALWRCFDKISNPIYHMVVVLSIRVAFEYTK